MFTVTFICPVTFISSLFLKYAKYTSALCILCLLLRTLLPRIFVKLTSSFSSQCYLSEKLSLTTLVKQLPIPISIFLVFFSFTVHITILHYNYSNIFIYLFIVYTPAPEHGAKKICLEIYLLHLVSEVPSTYVALMVEEAKCVLCVRFCVFFKGLRSHLSPYPKEDFLVLISDGFSHDGQLPL